MISSLRQTCIRLSLLIAATLTGLASSALAGDQIQQIGPSLAHPWGMSFVDETSLLITQRGGQMIKLNWQTGTSTQISNLPEVVARRQGGLLDVLVRKTQDGQTDVYICYSKPVPGGTVTAMDRAELEENRLTNRRTLFEANDISPRPYILVANAIHQGIVSDGGAVSVIIPKIRLCRSVVRLHWMGDPCR